MRNFVEVVSNNPTKFFIESSTSTIVHKESNGISLSLNFGNKIESGQFFNSNDINYNPILQIINTSTKIRKFALNSMERATKQATLQVSDEKGNYLTVKIASQLSDLSGNLKSGPIIEM